MTSFIYDVQLNFADGMSKSYLIPRYHEWHKDDEIDSYVCLPVVLVSKELFTFIEEEYDVLPTELLKLVYAQASRKISGKTEEVEYAFVITDGKRTLAVDTDEEEFPNLKSYLTPKHEGHILDMIHKLTPLVTSWEAPPPKEIKKVDQLTVNLLLMNEEYVKGLTRTEKDLKSILMTCLYSLSCSTSKKEVLYWYSELFPGTFLQKTTNRMSIHKLVEKMYDSLKEGWTDRHIRFGAELVQYNGLFKESWDTLIKRQKEKVESK